ncbi:hypothetical protein GCM10020227_67520 [Streptomyces flavovirens]
MLRPDEITYGVRRRAGGPARGALSGTAAPPVPVNPQVAPRPPLSGGRGKEPHGCGTHAARPVRAGVDAPYGHCEPPA